MSNDTLDEEVEQFEPIEKTHSVPKEEAEGYLHIGVDTAYEPVPGEGYWIPVADEELVEVNHPPRGHIIQYPKDDLEPHRVGEKDVPDWVQSWDYRDGEVSGDV